MRFPPYIRMGIRMGIRLGIYSIALGWVLALGIPFGWAHSQVGNGVVTHLGQEIFTNRK